MRVYFSPWSRDFMAELRRKKAKADEFWTKRIVPKLFAASL